jgi:hypothetical protein
MPFRHLTQLFVEPFLGVAPHLPGLVGEGGNLRNGGAVVR